jgi:Fe-S-cluster formation regulator IscX/YfhJ
MGKVPEKAEAKFRQANVFFGKVVADRYTIALPRRVDLKEIKREVMALEEKLMDIARGLEAFKEAVLLSLREVKKELNEIEGKLEEKG